MKTSGRALVLERHYSPPTLQHVITFQWFSRVAMQQFFHRLYRLSIQAGIRRESTSKHVANMQGLNAEA